MNWREMKLGDLADWVGNTVNETYESSVQYVSEKSINEMTNDALKLGKTVCNSGCEFVGDTYESSAKIVKDATQYLAETSLGEIADDASALSAEGLKQAQHIISSAPKESLGAMAAAAAAATAVPGGVAFGGHAVAATVIGGVIAVPVAHAAAVTALVGGAGYLAYSAYQKAYSSIPPEAGLIGAKNLAHALCHTHPLSICKIAEGCEIPYFSLTSSEMSQLHQVGACNIWDGECNTILVDSELESMLTHDELKALIAHEYGHSVDCSCQKQEMISKVASFANSFKKKGLV